MNAAALFIMEIAIALLGVLSGLGAWQVASVVVARRRWSRASLQFANEHPDLCPVTFTEASSAILTMASLPETHPAQERLRVIDHELGGPAADRELASARLFLGLNLFVVGGISCAAAALLLRLALSIDHLTP